MCLGVPGQIISIEGDQDDFFRMARVSFGGSIKEISLAYVPEASLDDYVIVHAGFALKVIDAQEADEVLGYLQQFKLS